MSGTMSIRTMFLLGTRLIGLFSIFFPIIIIYLSIDRCYTSKWIMILNNLSFFFTIVFFIFFVSECNPLISLTLQWQIFFFFTLKIYIACSQSKLIIFWTNWVFPFISWKIINFKVIFKHNFNACRLPYFHCI